MILNNTINRLAKDPKKLFLIDSLGAFLTAFLLFVILRTYHEFFGVPSATLILLSGIAAIFSIYSGICYLFLKTNWVPFIKAISFANLFYCLITLGLVFSPSSIITNVGKIYFLAEVLVVCSLVFIELTVARALKHKIL